MSGFTEQLPLNNIYFIKMLHDSSIFLFINLFFKWQKRRILNYFTERHTNGSAESLNSRIKCFQAQVKGVRDFPFFMYRLVTVLG